MSDRANSVARMARRQWPFVTLVLAILVLGAGGAALFITLLSNKDVSTQPTLATPMLVVAAFVTVILLFLFATVIFQVTDLQDKREALGMPQGSIRALIAMSLILIFAVVGVTIFFTGTTGVEHSSHGLTFDQLPKLGTAQILALNLLPGASGAPATYDVVTRADLPSAGHDFGLQLLSTISTLVVAVAGFYFGTSATKVAIKAAEVARGGSTTDATVTVVSPTAPPSLTKGSDQKWQPVDIVLNVEPPFLAVEPKVFGDPKGKVTSASRVRFTYTPDDPQGDVVVVFSAPDPYEAKATIALQKAAS